MLIALIPAYNPIPSLPDYVDQVNASLLFQHIIVVNDGSRPEYQALFVALKQKKNVTVLEHAINQGKGAALKTGLNEISLRYPTAIGTVTIDADGQHALEDACKVARALLEHPKALIIGGRHFDANTPLRSKFGNGLTRYLFKMITHLNLHDTQSGLRGIPLALNEDLLSLESNRYEFELDMLMKAKQLGFTIKEISIKTIYLNQNANSSFRPILDSLKIYFVLFRFTLIALLSALLDYGIFIFVYYLIFKSVFIALVCSRTCSIIFNYLNVRKFAFKNLRSKHQKTLPQYLILALFSCLTAYVLMIGFMNLLHLQVISAKIIAEIIMFIVNFFIQRELIFK